LTFSSISVNRHQYNELQDIQGHIKDTHLQTAVVVVKEEDSSKTKAHSLLQIVTDDLVIIIYVL